MKTKQGKIWRIAVYFYDTFCPLRLRWKIEKKNWMPKDISFGEWYESSGYEYIFEVPSLAEWVNR